MEITESIQQSILEGNELNVDKSLKAIHRLYRSSDKIPEYIDNE